ncbi:MAG: Ig-like domain-containing protein [Proteobacteria bacterium]|nr:Ig-like domain-containing protein [Pseudomonadota bacterium]
MMRLGLAVAVLAMAGGCTGTTLEDEWALTVSQLEGLPLEVVVSFPADGSDGVAYRIEPYALMSRPMNSEERASTLGLIIDTASYAEIGTHRELDSDFMGVSFNAEDDLSRGRNYSLDLSHASALASFSTASPDGWAFNMSSGLGIENFGGNRTHAQQLNDTFVPGEYPLWVMQLIGLPDPGAVAGTAQTFDWVFAPARLDDEDPPFLLRKEYGYVGRLMGVTLHEDGRYEHTQDGVFLPLWSADHVVLLYLKDVVLSGQMSLGADGITIESMSLTGVLGTRWLLQLREAGPAWRNAVGVMDLDIDTNGNDVPDAATFTLSSAPTAMDPADIDL